MTGHALVAADQSNSNALALQSADMAAVHYLEWSDTPKSTRALSCWARSAQAATGVNVLQFWTALDHVGTLKLHFEGVGEDLAKFALAGLGAYKLSDALSTSAPTDCSILFAGWRPWAGPRVVAPSKNDAVPTNLATRLIMRIRHASDLTLEAIAPLTRVSRRTLHSWQAGYPISQRNEERLRALCEAVEAIAECDPSAAREKIMRRIPGAVRIYDLLAEGQYDEAVKRATGITPEPRPAVYQAARAPSTSLSSQVATLQDSFPPAKSTLDRRLTRRFGR